MEQKGTDEWLQTVADEEPAAAYLAGVATRPDDAFVPDWAETYWRAWHALRFDRQYGAMGGQSPISFVSLDAYARRYGIVDMQFETLLVLVSAMDEEYLEHVARLTEKHRQEEEQRRENK